jgi:predicted Zn-dependent protease with MMP-like domain
LKRPKPKPEKPESPRERAGDHVFDSHVSRAIERIPRQFRDAMQNVEIVVEDWPDPNLMEEVTGMRDDVVYGLFVGKPLPWQSVGDWGEPPGLIYLYRGPLEEDFPDPRELAREIEITLVHEIAHYMGFDEEILAEYGYD